MRGIPIFLSDEKKNLDEGTPTKLERSKKEQKIDIYYIMYIMKDLRINNELHHLKRPSSPFGNRLGNNHPNKDRPITDLKKNLKTKPQDRPRSDL